MLCTVGWDGMVKSSILKSRRCGPLRVPSSSSCKGLWPSAEAFFWVKNYFFVFLGFLSKLLMLLLKVTKVTTGHQKLPKMGQNSIRSSFFAQRAKKASAEGQSPSQELEEGTRSGSYLLVHLIVL